MRVHSTRYKKIPTFFAAIFRPFGSDDNILTQDLSSAYVRL